MNRSRFALILRAAWLLGSATLGLAQAAPVFVNGSFESPTVTYQGLLGGNSTAIAGWTTALSGVEHYNSPVYGFGAAADGVMVVDLANYAYMNGGAIEQALDTVVGETYTVNFYAGNIAYAGRDGTGLVKISINGVELTDIATPLGTTTTVWEQRNFSFTATTTSSMVRFWNNQNPFQHFALIDGVSVVAPGTGGRVPEAPSLALAVLGLAGLAATRRHA